MQGIIAELLKVAATAPQGPAPSILMGQELNNTEGK